jgi:hypothetical protein
MVTVGENNISFNFSPAGKFKTNATQMSGAVVYVLVLVPVSFPLLGSGA